MYNLFLDDARQVKDVKWLELPLVQWKIVRNHAEFVNTLTKYGLPLRISFDHDLADQHYEENTWAASESNVNKGVFRYNKMREKTGYDCAKYLIEYCMKYDLDLPIYFVHTLNPIGRENIRSILESYAKFHNID